MRAGVSTATASHVFSGRKHVSAELSARVRGAASELGYRLNTVARALRTGHSGIIALIVPDITNPFFPQLARAVEAHAKKRGYALILIDAGYEASIETHGIDLLAGGRADGLIWVPSVSQAPRSRPSFPVVVFDHEAFGYSSVHADDYGGGRLQARFARESGHRDVTLIAGPQVFASARERRRGFRDEANGALNIVLELETPLDRTLPKALQRQLLKPPRPFSFVACDNDTIAVSVLRAFRAAGTRVPEDVSVIGFDNNMLAEIVDPPLTTIRQPIDKLGALAVDLLVRQIHGGADHAEHLIAPVTLIERASTRHIALPVGRATVPAD